jgi:hypothetical protein
MVAFVTGFSSRNHSTHVHLCKIASLWSRWYGGPAESGRDIHKVWSLDTNRERCSSHDISCSGGYAHNRENCPHLARTTTSRRPAICQPHQHMQHHMRRLHKGALGAANIPSAISSYDHASMSGLPCFLTGEASTIQASSTAWHGVRRPRQRF